jgi:hypothetical protein
MISFNELIQDPTQFQDFVRELALKFKTPNFPNYTEDRYSETRTWKAVAALNGRVPMASLIDPYSGKPIIGTEKALDMNGSMPTFGNTVTFSAKEFTEMEVIQRGIANQLIDPLELVKYLFNYFERLSIGPLITQDKLFFEAFSNGTSTILSADNLSGLGMSIDWGITKTNVSTVWSNAASATGLDDLKTLYWYMYNTYGIIVDNFTMNRKTFFQLQNQASTKAAMTSYFSEGNTMTKFMGTPSMDAINKVLVEGMMLPTINIEDTMVEKYNSDGTTASVATAAFLDGRVTAHVGTTIGQYLWTPADEQRRPDANVIYQDVNHVLLSTRSDRGKVTIESELSSICVPTLMNQMSILITDATA